jgi:hypothetical protein
MPQFGQLLNNSLTFTAQSGNIQSFSKILFEKFMCSCTSVGWKKQAAARFYKYLPAFYQRWFIVRKRRKA